MSIREQCKAAGIAFKTYCNRKYGYGWSHAEAIGVPVQRGQKISWDKLRRPK